MIWVDIILALCILASLVSGFRQGIVVQLGGIAGILLGVFLAFRYDRQAGALLGVDSDIAQIVGFIVILIAVLIIVSILGHMLKKVFRFAGLGIIDCVGGAALSGIKAVLILSLLVAGFDSLNRQTEWIEQQTLQSSKIYTPLRETAEYIFPYFDTLKNAWHSAQTPQ